MGQLNSADARSPRPRCGLPNARHGGRRRRPLSGILRRLFPGPVLALLIVFPPVLFSQAPGDVRDPAAPVVGARDLPAEQTGEPGWRARLAGRGLALRLTYIGEVFAGAAGGLRRRADYDGDVSLTLTFDLARILGWRGATLFVNGLDLHGRNPSLDIGDTQGVSNIGAHPALRLYEAWLEQRLWGDKLSLLAGVYDLNSEFAVIEAAGVFLNSSQAIDPVFAKSGVNGPSIFPYTALGFRARFTPSRDFYAQAVVLDGVAGDPAHPGGTYFLLRRSDGVLVAAEAGRVFWSSGKAPLRLHRRGRLRIYERPAHSGKLALGLWTYTAKFAPTLQDPGTLSRPRIGGYHGLYVLFSRVLLADNDEPQRHLAAFARLGAANPRVSRFDLFAGAGLVFNGPFVRRPGDTAGLALAVVRNGDDYLKGLRLAGGAPLRAEWDIELTYQARLAGWLSVQPDVQCVVHPNTDRAIRNALGIDLRVNASF